MTELSDTVSHSPRFSTVAARMKTRSRLFRSFWRPLERGVSLSSTTVDSRFIETSHDIPRRWWQSRSSRNRDYTVRFCPPHRKSSSSQGLAESLASSPSNTTSNTIIVRLVILAIIFDPRMYCVVTRDLRSRRVSFLIFCFFFFGERKEIY